MSNPKCAFRIWMVTLVIFAASGCIRKVEQFSASVSFSGLKKLEGVWQGRMGDGFFYENWNAVNDSTMTGFGFSIRGADTLSSEGLRLELRKDDVWYIADVPANDSAVAFRLSTVEGNRFAFENKKHDFPTSIVYNFVSQDSLKVRISGVSNGAEKAIDFTFARVI